MKEERKEQLSREEKIKELTEKLELGVKDLFESDRYRNFLEVMSRFPRYSANNCVLIAMQKPDAFAVGGFHHWKRMGRSVAPGEKGLQIIQPAPKRVYRWETVRDEDGNVVYNDDGSEKKVRVPHEYMDFTVGYVWDYSQTIGPPGTELPSMVRLLDGDAKNGEALLKALEATSSAAISYEDYGDRSNGYFDPQNNRIVVKASLPALQRIKTLAHERVHEVLHSEGGIEEAANRHEREIEAESVSFIILNYFGIDSSDYTFGYVQSWASGRDLPELQTKLEIIRKTAYQMIEEIENEIVRQKVIEVEVEEEREMTAEATVVCVQYNKPQQHISHRRR